MSHLLAVSPHLDDAAFSIGGTLAAHAAAGGRVTIVTCFTANVTAPSGFALACQLDKGLAPEIDYMALRRAEDRAACAVIGAEAVHLPFLEAPHRGYASAPALFGALLPDDDVCAPLARALAEIVAALAPDIVAGPLALGDHVDHRIVRAALSEIADDVRWWEDWPYVDRVGASDVAVAWRTPLDTQRRASRLAMAAAYASQIGFQFGGLDALVKRLDMIDEERLHRYPG